MKKTLVKIPQRFYWLRCQANVEDWCRRYNEFAPVSHSVGTPWESIAVDFAGPFLETDGGNLFIIVLQYY